jgi:hypothetical protein
LTFEKVNTIELAKQALLEAFPAGAEDEANRDAYEKRARAIKEIEHIIRQR